MNGVSSKVLSQLTGFPTRVIEVVEIGVTCFTIGRFETEIGQVVHVVHTIGIDGVSFFYSDTARNISTALKVGYVGRAKEPEQLSMPI